jgi:hypothetical protein
VQTLQLRSGKFGSFCLGEKYSQAIDIGSNGSPAQSARLDESGSSTHEWVEDEVAGL